MTIKLDLPPIIADNQKTIVLSKWLQKLKLAIDEIQDTLEVSLTDHGQFAGLADNDHPQYAEVANSETISGVWTYSSGAIPLSRANATTSDGLTRKGYVDAQDILLSGAVLHLDQTTPQSVINGSPIFEGLQFDTTPSTSNISEGLLRWNATDGTLDLGMQGGDITMQLGQEMFTKVRNDTGATITNASVVYISGRTGVYPDVKLARSDVNATSRVLGVATENILNTGDKFGYVTTVGYVRGIKTDYTGAGIWGATWVTGDILYVSKTVAGQLTNVEPGAPHHSDVVGTVGIVHQTLGTILVTLDRKKTLEMLTDVNGTALTITGQFPVWNQTAGYFDFDYNIANYFKLDQTTPQTVSGGIPLFNSGLTLNGVFDVTGVSGDLNFFEDTLIADGSNGKLLVIKRHATEGDTSLTQYINSDGTIVYNTSGWQAWGLPGLSMLIGGDFVLDSQTGRMQLNPFYNRDIYMFDETTANPYLYQYGYITAAAAKKYIRWSLLDSTDWFTIAREDTNVLGFDCTMPFKATTITTGTGATIDEISTDGTMLGNSDTVVPTEKAVKTYVDLAVSSLKLDEYFSSTASSIGGIYYLMDAVPATAGTVVSAAITSNTTTNVFNFATDVDRPHLERLLAGNYDIHAHLLKTGNRTITCYFELYQRNLASTETLLGTSSSTTALTTVNTFYDLYINIPTEVALLTTDRLVLKTYAVSTGAAGNTTVTMSVGGVNDPHFTIDISASELNNIIGGACNTVTVAALQSKNKFSSNFLCDGTADDVQIQAAIDLVYSLPATGSTIGGAGGKGQVILLEGTYIIDSPIKLKPGINIKGMGTTSTVIKAKTNFNNTLMVFDEPTVNPSVAVFIEGIYFDGNMTNQTVTSSAFDSKIGTIALWDLHINKCSFFDFKGEVLTIDDPWGFVLNECVIEDSASSALTVNAATKTTGVSITNNKIIQTGISTSTHAITLSGCTGCRIDNNEINGYGSGSGIKILNGGGNIVTSNYLGGNTYGNGLNITTSSFNIISGNSFMLNLSGLTVTSGTNNIITNNIFSSITNTEIADTGTTTYIYGNKGDDTATNNDSSTNSNSGLLIPDNAYAFKAQTAPLAGMYFNATNTSLDVKNTSGTSLVQLSLDGATRSSIGTKCDGYVVRPSKEVATTDATLTAIDTIPILDNNTYNCEATVIGVKSDGTDRAAYKVLCTVYRTGAGNATLQGTSTALYTSESDATWDAVFAVIGDTNLYVGVTGKAATNIAWSCIVKYMNSSN